MSFNELSPRKQQFLREVFDPSLNKEQRTALLKRYGYEGNLEVEGIQSVIDGMARGVAQQTTPLAIGWVTPQLERVLDLSGMQRYLERQGSKLSAREVLYKLNRAEDFTLAEKASLYLISYRGGDDSIDVDELQVRQGNILVPYEGGIAGQSYTLTLKEAQRVADFAVKCWREERYSRPDFSVDVPREGSSSLAVSEDRIAIGCQGIARAEVLRIAALFGWGGLTKQEGPKLEQKVAELT